MRPRSKLIAASAPLLVGADRGRGAGRRAAAGAGGRRPGPGALRDDAHAPAEDGAEHQRRHHRRPLRQGDAGPVRPARGRQGLRARPGPPAGAGGDRSQTRGRRDAVQARHPAQPLDRRREGQPRAGAQGGPDHARRRAARGRFAGDLVRRAQGSRLREGRQADLRRDARFGAQRGRVEGRPGVRRSRRPGARGPPRRPGQLLRDRQRIPRAAAQVAVRASADHAAPLRHRHRRPAEARDRRGRAGHAGARLLHQPAARACWTSTSRFRPGTRW